MDPGAAAGAGNYHRGAWLKLPYLCRIDPALKRAKQTWRLSWQTPPFLNGPPTRGYDLLILNGRWCLGRFPPPVMNEGLNRREHPSQMSYDYPVKS